MRIKGRFAVHALTLIVSVPVALLVLTRSANAESIGIQVFNSTYTTTVSSLFQDFESGSYTAVPEERTSTGSAPASDALLFASFGHALADAALFSVVADTAAVFKLAGDYLDRAAASATSVIDFSPVADATGDISVSLAAFGSAQHSSGSVRLQDLTTGTVVWDMGWDNVGAPPVYGVTLPMSPLRFEGPQAVETALLASNLYRLTMFTRTNAQGDSQRVELRTSGLHTVPEPEPLVLLTVGCVAMALRRRHSGRLRLAFFRDESGCRSEQQHKSRGFRHIG
jgi:hypothetical protein